MGCVKILSGGSRHSVEYIKVATPNPLKFAIKFAKQIGQYTILKINYPDSENFEGNKICVFKDTVESLKSKKSIDPHFYEDSTLIARFKPTEEGFKMATNLCMQIEGKL